MSKLLRLYKNWTGDETATIAAQIPEIMQAYQHVEGFEQLTGQFNQNVQAMFARVKQETGIGSWTKDGIREFLLGFDDKRATPDSLRTKLRSIAEAMGIRLRSPTTQKRFHLACLTCCETFCDGRLCSF